MKTDENSPFQGGKGRKVASAKGKVGKRGRPLSVEQSLMSITRLLERFVELKELELGFAGGLTTSTGEEIGEVLYTDPDLVDQKEKDATRKRAWGLPDSASLSPTDENGVPWGWGSGPEGSEESSEPLSGAWRG